MQGNLGAPSPVVLIVEIGGPRIGESEIGVGFVIGGKTYSNGHFNKGSGG